MIPALQRRRRGGVPHFSRSREEAGGASFSGGWREGGPRAVEQKPSKLRRGPR